MQHALAVLAAVFAQPAAPGASAALDELRARWPQLAPDERAALTPIARLAAQRVQAAAAGSGDPDEDAYLAYLASMEATVDAEAQGAIAELPAGASPSPSRPPAVARRHDASPRDPDRGAAAPRPGETAATAPPRPSTTATPSGRAGSAAPTLFEEAPAPPRDAPRQRASLAQVTPDGLLGLLGLSTFRPGQREAVQSALDGRDSLVVMPTGGGKSLCYQLPALAGDDLTVVVSPLIALMRDQCARLTDLGHPAVMLASGGDGESNRAALEQIRDGRASVVFAAPERFASSAFRGALQRRALALFVVDEAHCVSEWGHDFRPDYLRLVSVIAELGHPPVMACTATATPKVAEEIVARLGLREPVRVRSGFDRPNLSFDVLPFDGEGSVARKRATLVAGVAMTENRPAVVYCGTRKSTEEVADLLGGEGLEVVAYHAGMNADTRSRRQDAFMTGAADVVVATNAFGMGVDKADVRSVWHWALPSSLEAYYQEAGRAGRDGEPARAVLLASRSDLGRLVRFIREAEVTVEQVGAIVGRLRARSGGEGAIELSPEDDRDRIALAVAERAGALTLAPGSGGRVRVQLSARDLDHGRARQLCREATNRRWESYRSIERYATGDETCRRRQLLDHFGDDTPAAPSGRCCDVHDPPDWLPAITVAAKRSRGSGGGQASLVEDGPPVSDAELAPLKAWRRDRAEGKPAYTVATDATLREVVRRKPQTADELLAIKGIGPSFVTKHADSLLELLQAS
ncbi:MAG TPA: RecQ family ATP-dependent DNA helicase [Solirubrobacteraceae bacterium]|nr:RecQ family ATP-dependent DNA helicase [Solirubrobacteraceae bacterium]